MHHGPTEIAGRKVLLRTKSPIVNQIMGMIRRKTEEERSSAYLCGAIASLSGTYEGHKTAHLLIAGLSLHYSMSVCLQC